MITITRNAELMVAGVAADVDRDDEIDFVDGYVPVDASRFTVVDSGHVIVPFDEVDTVVEQARASDLDVEIENQP